MDDTLIGDLDIYGADAEKIMDLYTIHFNDFYYQGTLVEHLKMIDLMDEDYFGYFLSYAMSKPADEGEGFDPTYLLFFMRLLAVRLYKNKNDFEAFYLLNECASDVSIIYEAIYHMEDILILLFVRDIFSFIEFSIRCENYALLEFLLGEEGSYKYIFEAEIFFIKEPAQANFKKGQLFLSGNSFNKELERTLRAYPTEKVVFTPAQNTTNFKISSEFDHKIWNEGKEEADKLQLSYYDWKKLRQQNEEEYNLKWQNKVIYLNDVSDYFIADVLRKCGDNESYIATFEHFIYGKWLSKYVIRNYHVNSKDGYANLRTKPNINSEIITTIKNDEYVCFLEDAGDWEDWVKVHYPVQVIEGYIHKSQLEER